MRTPVVFAILGALIVSGCLGAAPPKFQPVQLVEGAFKMDLPIHIVAVGFEDFEGDLLQSKLRQPIAPYKLIRYGTTGDERPEPLQYRLDYQVHEAPEAFAQELFAFAKTVTTPGKPDSFLQSYDLAGPARVCSQPANMIEQTIAGARACEDIARVDAMKVETWIHDNRAAHGLAFPEPGYTIFLLDSYTKAFLPKDSYHVYAIDDGTKDSAVKNQRAWGGAYDFVFLDVAAAPNRADFVPWANYTNAGNPLAGLEDRPIWDYDLSKHGAAGTGASPALLRSQDRDATTFYANLAQNVYDAGRILWARSPIYPFEYYEKYILPMYIFIDPNAHTNPDSPLARFKPTDVEKNTDVADIEAAFKELVPWAAVDLRVEFVYLPEDDAPLQAALQDAKTRYANGEADFGILKKYFRENWAKYAPSEPGARTYPTFAFWLEAPSQGIFAYSDGDELGNSWGVFYNAADTALCLRPAKPVCFVEELFADEATWWKLWNAILVHELGHSFGLTHPHDTGGYDADHFWTYEVNWLWDSTSSVMTYRHSITHFNQFDQDLIFRGNAVEMALKLKATDEKVADDVFAKLTKGDYEGAFGTAREAMKARTLMSKAETHAAAGPSVTTRVSIPVGVDPLGYLPLPVGLPVYAPEREDLQYVEFPVTIAPGTGVQMEYREVAGVSHAKWAAFGMLLNAKGEVLTYLGNNGYDKVIYLNSDRCADGCVGRIYSLSGVGGSYDVTLTPVVA